MPHNTTDKRPARRYEAPAEEKKEEKKEEE